VLQSVWVHHTKRMEHLPTTAYHSISYGAQQ
jgi:hypothetical protein